MSGGDGGRCAPQTRIFCVLTKRQSEVSWLVRVKERNATQRGPGSAHSLPAQPVLYRRLEMLRRLQHANPAGERDEQTLVGLRECMLAVDVLERDHARRTSGDDQRDEEV